MNKPRNRRGELVAALHRVKRSFFVLVAFSAVINLLMLAAEKRRYDEGTVIDIDEAPCAAIWPMPI